MEDITVQEVKTRLDAGESFTFIDVREPWEYEEFNIGAKLIPMNILVGQLNELFEDKNDEIVLHCKSGSRSGMVKQILVANGFTNVRNMLGGVLEWKANYAS